MLKTHKDLDVWKSSINFVTNIYKITDTFPEKEVYGLISQIRRSSVSIPSNIAEGAARNGKKEFKQFLYIALSSAAEVETQIIISEKLNYLKEDEAKMLLDSLNNISKMLFGLIKSLKI